MFMTSDDIEFFVVRVVVLREPSQETRNNNGVFMTDKEIIDMPANSHLLVIDEFVGNARIIGVYFKTKGKKISHEFAIKQ